MSCRFACSWSISVLKPCQHITPLEAGKSLTHCMLGYKMATWRKICCIIMINKKKKLRAGGKQAGAKTRSHIRGTWSWLQPVCKFTKILIHQYPKWNGLINRFKSGFISWPNIHSSKSCYSLKEEFNEGNGQACIWIKFKRCMTALQTTQT